MRVEGAKALSRALRKAGLDMKDMKEANHRVGDVVVRAAKPLAPKKSGALSNSIRAARLQSGVTVRAGGGRVVYPVFVEYGTVKMGARPYLRTGMQQSKWTWLPLYDRELKRLMRQVEASSTGSGP